MRTIALASLVVATALAGCLSSSQPPAALDPASLAPAHVLDYAGGCSEQLAILPTPLGDLQAQVPEGFEVVPFDPLGLFGVMAGITFACGTLTGMVAEEEAVTEMAGFISVVPPEELRGDGIDTYAIPIGVYTSSEATADLLNAWDIAASVAPVAITTHDLTVVRADIGQGADGSSSVTVVTASVLPVSQAAGVARVFGVRDGMVTGAVDFAWTASEGKQGVAALLFSDGSFPLPVPGVGLGFQYNGEDYAYHLEHKPLAALLAAGGSTAPVTSVFGVPMPQKELPSGELLAGLL